ncbi:MAG TPA: hypothetical protein VFO16_01535 [Pseudonocardiaceae bacterium]|nr:hypothetical protein [Pseudonocardiaceae bacterium]
MNSPMLDRQFELEDPQAGARLVCWLRDDRRLTVGRRITLKETGSRVWIIAKRYITVVEDADLNRKWHVGGLK